MLDGQVLGASQVEYKPFGKPPLKREVLCSVFALLRGAVCSCRCSRCAVRAFSAVSQTVRICRGRDSDFALHRGRFSDFAVASDFARKILRKRCGGERIASGVGFHPENPIAGPAPKVRQRCCPRSIADISPLTRPAVNPGVGTGLPHSILAWAQDCPTQSWRKEPSMQVLI